MTENVFTPHTEPQAEPTLRRNLELPKGVLQKNLKTFVYLGAVLLVIVAALFSSSGKKTPAQQASAKGQPPQPALQDNTDSNVQELKNQLQAERQKEQQATMAAAAMGDSALASATPQQRAAAAAYGPTGVAVPCIPGQPCPQAQQGNMQMQLTPVQQQAQLIAAKERERADNSRFASNLVYSRSADPPQQQQQGQTMPAQYGPAERQTNSSLVSPPAEGKQEDTPGGYKRPLEANVDSAVGQPYLVYEGSVLDTVLMNRLDGDAVGPVKVLVSNPLYSHDHQHVIIPEGTVVLGEAKKIGAAGLRPTAPHGSCFSPPDYAGWLLRRSRSVPRPRSDRRGRTERQGQQPLPPNLRHLDRFGCDCWSKPDHAGWRHHYNERFPGIHERGGRQCFAVCHHDP